MSSESDGARIPDPRDRNLDARRRAIAAGLVALVEHGDDLLTDGLHRKRLASISQQSRQTLYQHFPDHTEYLDEMIRVALDPTDPTWTARDLTDYVREVIEDSGDDSLGLVHRLAGNDFEALLVDEHWQLVIAIWALARNRPTVRTQLDEIWRHYNRRTADALDLLLDVWQADLQPPFDTERAAHVFGALGEGLAMRGMVSDEVDAELFADTVAAIAHAIVVPRGEAASFEPDLPHPGATPPEPLGQAAIERVLVCALDRYATQARRPTFGDLARDTGCSEASLRRHFIGMDRVVTAVWDRLGADLTRHHHDLDPELPVLARLSAQIGRVLDMAMDFPALNAELIRISITPTNTGTEVRGADALLALSAPIEELLREARQTGAIGFDVPPPLLATHLVATAIGQAITWPTGSDRRHRDTGPVLALVWRLTLGPWLPGVDVPPIPPTSVSRATAAP